MRKSDHVLAAAVFSVLGGFAAIASAVPTIDGTRDAEYGAPTAVQTANTGFDDSNNILNRPGSEIDNFHYTIDNASGRLNLFIGGNLETNNNKLVLFFDTVAGGQNTLRNDNPDVNFNNLNGRYGSATVNNVLLPGFTFDTGFEADRFISLSRDQGDGVASFGNVYVDYAELRTGGGGTGGYLGSIGVAGTGTDQQGFGTVGGTGGLPTVQVGVNDNNSGGVTGAQGTAADANAAAAVSTGAEFSFSLADLGIEGDFKITAFINGRNHDYVSNQFIAGLPSTQTNLGGDGAGNFITSGPDFGVVSGVNLNSFAGNQYITIPFTAPSFTYNVNANGNYSNGANFTGNTVPTGANGRVTFGNVITAARTVTIDQDISLLRLTFDSANSYTLAGTKTITIAGGAATPAIRVLNGSHTISAPVVLSNDTRIETTTAGSALTIAGTLNGSGKNLFKIGPGTLTIPQTPVNSLTVNGGTLRLAGSGNTSLRGITVDVGTVLDITNGALVLNYDEGFSPRDTIKASVAAGRILSSTITGPNRAVGFVDSAANPSLIAFNGEPVDATTLVFRATLRGDSDIDRDVDFDDLLALARNYSGLDKQWYQGDTNYDGAVNFDDLLNLAKNYGGSIAPAAAAQFSADFASDFALAQSLVPEPTVAFAGILAAGGLLGRRRK